MAASLGQHQEQGVLWGILSCPWQPALLSPGLLGLAFGAGLASAWDFTLDSVSQSWTLRGGQRVDPWQSSEPHGEGAEGGVLTSGTPSEDRSAGEPVLWIPGPHPHSDSESGQAAQVPGGVSRASLGPVLSYPFS